MTSVNTQQYAPNHATYEMSPKPAPIRHEDSAEAQASPSTQSASTAPRQPMSMQQRGPFSKHSDLVGTPASTKQADPARLEQLSQENNQLRNALNQLVAQFTPLITQLRQEVADLTQKLNKGGEGEEGRSPSTQGVTRGAESGAPTEASAPQKNTPVPEQEAPHSLQQLTAENNQLRETVDRLQTQFAAFVKELQAEIQALNKKLDGKDASPDQAAPQGAGAGVSTSSDSSPVAKKPDVDEAKPSPQVNEPTPSDSRTVDDLIRENEQLRARIEQMIAQFTQVISQLKQQIEQLNKRFETQAK